MSFEILQPRSVDDAPDPLYPRPGDQPNSFVPEPNDGSRTLSYETSGVIATSTVQKVKSEVGRAENIKGTFTLTDSRLVFACTEFRTGGGWRGGGVGGVLVAAAANAASRVAATRQTRGYSLVGHIRYQWLAAIRAEDRAWGRSSNGLRIVMVNPTLGGGTTALSVFPPNRQPATQIAQEIARRAARFQIARTDDAELRARLEEWARRAAPTVSTDGSAKVWTLPR